MTQAPAKRNAALQRCPWAGDDAEYRRYHDEEWGVPLTNDRALFEKLCLEGFQAGLSWVTILRKRDNFRRAFDRFEPQRVARYGAKDIARLMQDAGIVRNRAKIEATIDNAKTYLALRKHGTLQAFLWDFLDAGPMQNRHRAMTDIPTETELSRRISRALKAEGFRFVGSTTMYAFMQSVGMVNDHLLRCHRYAACQKLQQASASP